MKDGVAVPEAVLCIPGPWIERADLTRQLVQSNTGYLFAGMLLMDTKTNISCELQMEPRDERMSGAFKAAGPHWSHTDEMKQINDHASVIYLVGHGGSQTNFAPLMHAARALLDAGGHGIKVESTGLAHSPKTWRRLCDDLHLFSAHEACVVYITGADVYSCGMHNLGLKDVVVAADAAEDPAELLRAFTRYVFAEQPDIRPGQTFSVAADAPVFRIVEDAGVEYEPSSLFKNPYGFWRLEPVDLRLTEGAHTKRSWWKFRKQ
ncbi:hypothetical protein ABIC89_002434 [Variovorax boronicumulans]|uniref:DUF4261 domain-containing protein n=1 Tax=Variovorax boronicumulans TaxID=436515 RepID=UPI0033967CB0